MFKIINSTRKFQIIFLISIIILSFPSKPYAEDSLAISRWLIESELLENGDLYIEEDITFDFSGKFSGVFREIVLEKTSGVKNIEVGEIIDGKEIKYDNINKGKKGNSNVFTIDTNNNSKTVTIYSPSKDQKKTFKIKYTVKNVAIKHNDTGELNYQFLGSENKTPIEFFSVNIKLPQNRNNKVKIFAHGPLNGMTDFKDENLVHMEVEDVPKNTFVEGRILFPNNFIPKSSNLSNKSNYNNILNEEKALIKDIEKKELQKEKITKVLSYASLIAGGIGIITLALFLSKLKRKINIYEKTSSNIIPEDCSPAVASYLTLSHNNTEVIVATILDLVRKGYFKIEKNEKEGKPTNLNIIKIKNQDEKLLKHESFFIQWIIDTIGTGNDVDIENINKYGENYNDKFLEDFNKWQNLVKKETEDKGYFDLKVKKYGYILTVFSIIFFIISIATIAYGVIYGLFPLIISIIVFIYGLTLLSRKSDEGHVQYKKWKKFIKYMKNTKKININKEDLIYPLDMTLIYAIALGLNTDILDNFKSAVSDKNYTNNSWIYWYFFSGNKHILHKSMEEAFNPISNYNSSNIGGGGNFSGGGGTGAGGGGAGGF
ncbi:MAG: DUF2207 domain-containing protein [Clostridiaceae bacterium]|nr:DUF2207 domain-containing protein [Clostridiaceae bacterium]MBW4860938.1 DUF2207 domain-containing protein [Clostridiaceae bacterium]MBW4867563.1 DUF2207 domain-containing protein [Clostridiaceae bacterium]